MSHTVIFGIGFGDETKGSISDAYVRRTGAKTVVRYCGGPQAGHNIVSPEGVWHCCAQFGAGVLAGADTYISRFMPIELEALEAEAAALESKGITDPLAHITLDARCLVITPGHKLVNQLREILRGKHRNGSCGMGVGETITDAERGLSITLRDLSGAGGLRKLQWLLERKQAEAKNLPDVQTSGVARERMEYFRERMRPDTLYETYVRILDRLNGRLDTDGSRLQAALNAGPTVCEGAQGALLDKDSGFAPYITKSRVTWHNAQELLARATRPIKKIAVLRAYAHRHGAGPLVTEDDTLRNALDDPRNPPNDWQGRFRVGWLDRIALRYGLLLNDGADQLALAHLDRFAGLGPVRVCTSYLYEGDEAYLENCFSWERSGSRIIIHGINHPQITPGFPTIPEILFKCRPHDWLMFDGWSSFKDSAAQRFIRWIESSDGLNTPVGVASFGPRADQKQFLLD